MTSEKGPPPSEDDIDAGRGLTPEEGRRLHQRLVDMGIRKPSAPDSGPSPAEQEPAPETVNIPEPTKDQNPTLNMDAKEIRRRIEEIDRKKKEEEIKALGEKIKDILGE